MSLVRNIAPGGQLINQRAFMDTADLREKAQTCRRWAEALPRNDPERFYLLELHDDLLACAVRVRRRTTKSSPPLKFKLSNCCFRNSSGSLAIFAAMHCLMRRAKANRFVT